MPVVLGDSSGLVVSLGAGSLPHVRIIVNGAILASGTEYAITGSVDGFTWPVRGGTGPASGAQVTLADSLAPLNESATYTVSVDGTTVAVATITRTYTGTGGDGLARDVISSLDSRSFAGVRRQGGDSRSGERRFHASTVRGSRWSPLRLDPVAGAGGGSLEVATVGTHTTSMRNLLDSNALVAYFHDRSRCGLPSCDVEPAQVIYVTDDDNGLGPRVDVAERVWSLGYLVQSDPESGFVQPLQSWADLRDAGLTWGQLRDAGILWGEVSRTIWNETE